MIPNAKYSTIRNFIPTYLSCSGNYEKTGVYLQLKVVCSPSRVWFLNISSSSNSYFFLGKKILARYFVYRHYRQTDVSTHRCFWSAMNLVTQRLTKPTYQSFWISNYKNKKSMVTTTRAARRKPGQIIGVTNKRNAPFAATAVKSNKWYQVSVPVAGGYLAKKEYYCLGNYRLKQQQQEEEFRLWRRSKRLFMICFLLFFFTSLSVRSPVWLMFIRLTKHLY